MSTRKAGLEGIKRYKYMDEMVVLGIHLLGKAVRTELQGFH